MTPQIPPIPTVPITDPVTGRVAREWWRWFHLVFQVQNGQDDEATLALMNSLTRDSLPDLAQLVFDAQAKMVPADNSPPVSQVAFLAQTLVVPPDAIDPDQIVMRSMMLSVPR